MKLDLDHDQRVADLRDEVSERELMLRNARRETESKLALYGSIDKWPALLLEPKQFKRCTCGCARTDHRLIGTDRAGCKNCPTCRLFTFRGYASIANARGR